MMKVVKEDKMIEAVLEHLSKDFFPDEPVFRSFIIVIVKIIITNTDHTNSFTISHQVCGGGPVQRLDDVRVQDLS